MRVSGAITILFGSWIAPSRSGVKNTSLDIRKPLLLVAPLTLFSLASTTTHQSRSETDFAHVDCNQQRFLHNLIVPFVRINPALRRHDDPVDIAIFRRIVQPSCSAENVNRVVVPAQQTIRPKARYLFAAVTFHAVRKGHLESPPRFTFHLNRRNLLGRESFMRVKKGSVEIGPQRFAAKVSNVDVIPRRLPLLPLEGFLRIIARINQRPIR